MFRKAAIFIFLILSSVIVHAQNEDPWRILGEMLRSEGLHNDTDSLFHFMDKSLSFDFNSISRQAGPLSKTVGNYSTVPSPKEICEGAAEFRNYIDSVYSDSISEKGLVASAELGYFGYIAGIDSLVDYAYKAYMDAFENKKENFLALYYSINDQRYIRSPFIVLGDVMLENGHPDYAQTFYRQAYPLDVFSQEYLHKSSPEEIYHSIWTIRDGQQMYKSTYSYPIHMERLAKAAYRNNESVYEDYLNEAFYYAVERLYWSICAMDIFEQERLLTLYSSIFSHQFGNSDTGWAYDAALFIKGCSNSMAADVRKVYMMDESEIDTGSFGGYVPSWMTDDERRHQIKAFFPSQVYSDYQTAMESYRMNSTEENRQKVRELSRRIQQNLLLSRAHAPSLTATYMDIHDSLKPDEVAVEFVRVVSLGNEEPEYHALIITPESDKPERVVLCRESKLKELVSNDQVGIYGDDSHELYDLIWKPLASHLNGAGTVYYSPDGLLYTTNPDAPVGEDGRRVFETFNTVRLSSTKDIVKHGKPLKYDDAVLYGGLTYSMASKDMIAQNSRYANYVSATRGYEAGPDRTGWSELPGTKVEVERISDIMTRSSCTLNIRTGSEGTEESFKHMSGNSPDILHLATHGFFLGENDIPGNYMQSLLLSANYPSLRRSGLILAGGQRAWLGETIPSQVEDGILLSEEIANLELSGTGLVVLSACETALGDISEQGVEGLQKVFKRAGADKMVMSLWRVDDKATMLFMTKFYESNLSSHDITQAFRDAQSFMCSTEEYSDPYFWAGFILVE